MRATLSTTYRSLLATLNRNTSRLEDLRNQAATGKKVTKPSDDPSAIRPMLNARGQIRTSERFLDTMGTAADRLNVLDGHLDQVENLMVRVKEIGVASGNGTLSDDDLETLADQVANVRDELFALGNSQVNGKYIFSGYSEDTAPFVANASYNPADPTSSPVTYQGDGNQVKYEIAPGEKVTVNVTGDDLFKGRVDVFRVLEDMETALRAHDPDASLAQLDSVDDGAEQVRRLRSQMGNIADRVDKAMLNMEGTQVDMKEVLSRYEDADIVETLTNLTQQETAFKAALDVTSRVSQLSILDYMR